MPEPVERTGTDIQLRERIDALATQLLLDGASAGLATALAQLSQLAGGRNCPETARIASELAERTRAGEKGEPAAFEGALCEGIAQLRKVLETEAAAASPPPAPASAAPPPVLANSLAEDPELISDFIFESREHLASIESRMLVLEQNPADTEAIHSAFRGFHTIKGLAGFLELPVIQEVAHEVETVLDLARNGKLSITPAVVDVVLESADYLKQAIHAVEAKLTGNTPQPAGDHHGLLAVRRFKAASVARRITSGIVTHSFPHELNICRLRITIN